MPSFFPHPICTSFPLFLDTFNSPGAPVMAQFRHPPISIGSHISSFTYSHFTNSSHQNDLLLSNCNPLVSVFSVSVLPANTNKKQEEFTGSRLGAENHVAFIIVPHWFQPSTPLGGSTDYKFRNGSSEQ